MLTYRSMISKLIKTHSEINSIREISRLRNWKLNSIVFSVFLYIIYIADADELAAARASLQSTMDQTRASNAGLSERMHQLDLQNEDIMRKILDTQKYLDQLLAQ